MWDYFIDATYGTVKSIKNAWLLFKAICFLVYASFAAAVAFTHTDIVVSIILLAILGVECLIFILLTLFSFFKQLLLDKKNVALRATFSIAQIARIALRLISVSLLFFLTVTIVNQSTDAWAIISMIFACMLLLFIYAKELIYSLYKYVKYRAKKAIEKAADDFARDYERIENAYGGRLDNTNSTDNDTEFFM